MPQTVDVKPVCRQIPPQKEKIRTETDMSSGVGKMTSWCCRYCSAGAFPAIRYGMVLDLPTVSIPYNKTPTGSGVGFLPAGWKYWRV
jgi:hypothetical protein